MWKRWDCWDYIRLTRFDMRLTTFEKPIVSFGYININAATIWLENRTIYSICYSYFTKTQTVGSNKCNVFGISLLVDIIFRTMCLIYLNVSACQNDFGLRFFWKVLNIKVFKMKQFGIKIERNFNKQHDYDKFELKKTHRLTQKRIWFPANAIPI